MTFENIKKNYAHLLELIGGKVKTGNPTRDALIVSDAERTLAVLVKKFPQLEAKEEIKEVKSKEKK